MITYKKSEIPERLQKYFVPAELGLEKTPEEFIARMVEVFRHVKRVLRDDGSVWLNLGDSYAAGKMGRDDGGNKSGGFHGQPKHAQTKPKQRKPPAGLKPKDLCGIPWRVALALQADGWYLRQDIIWHKPNPMPESVRDRCTKAHEYLFLLTKKPTYFCDMEAVKEPSQYPSDNRKARQNADDYDGMMGPDGQKRAVINPKNAKAYPLRNKRSVWTVTTKPYKEAHFATFPPKLIEPCVLAGTSAEGQCPECGTPWVRVVEKVDTGQTQKMADGWDTGDGGHGTIHREGREAGEAGKPVMVNQTTGWEAGCKCYCDDSDSQIVFDPFMGSGTTGMVAKQNGRDYLGIELNPEYIDLINERIKSVSLPLLDLDSPAPECV